MLAEMGSPMLSDKASRCRTKERISVEESSPEKMQTRR